jgi:ribosomal protein L7/L12
MSTDSTRLNDAMHRLREIAVNLTMKGEYDNAKTILEALVHLENFAPALDELGDEVRKLAHARDLVGAVKALRERRRDMGLKECKDAVEAYMASQKIPPKIH